MLICVPRYHSVEKKKKMTQQTLLEDIGNVFGYLAVFFVCIRLLPPIVDSMREKKPIPFALSYVFLETCACISYLIYASIYYVIPLLITNTIILIMTMTIYFYNRSLPTVVFQDDSQDVNNKV